MLVATQVALDLVRDLRPLVERIRKHDNTLAKQLVDAMNSTVQNLREGEAHRGGNKRLKYEIAYGEANEVRGSLELAAAWGYIADGVGCARKAGATAGALLWPYPQRSLARGRNGQARLAKAQDVSNNGATAAYSYSYSYSE